MRLWNPARGTHVKTYTGHGYDVRDVAVTADNARLASVGGDRAVIGWDVATGAVVRRWRGHDGPANAVAHGPADATVVTGGDDATVRVWDARSRSADAVATLRGARDSVTSVTLLNTSIVSASVDGAVRVHDVRVGRVTADAVGAPVVSVAVTRDGGAIAAACVDGRALLLDAASGAELASYRDHPPSDVKTDIAVSPDDGAIVLGGADGVVRWWDLVSERVLARTPAAPPGKPVTSLAVRPDGGALLAASVDGVRVFEL